VKINVYDDKGEKRTGRGKLQGSEPVYKCRLVHFCQLCAK
jgi:hypothetical protein